MTPGDRHLKPACSQLEGAWDRGPSLAEGERNKNWDSSEKGGWEGSQEVCKDSSALSHHYKRPWLYHCLPPEGVFQLQLIKSPWARCLGQVFKHKRKSTPPPPGWCRSHFPTRCLNLAAKPDPVGVSPLGEWANVTESQLYTELSSTLYRTWQLHSKIID